MAERSRKIAIIGAGEVGATVGYALLIRGVARHLVLYDLDSKKVQAQALDLNHGLLFIPPATIEGSDDVNICKDAAVIIVCAGAKQKPGQTRIELAATNAKIVGSIVRDARSVPPPVTTVARVDARHLDSLSKWRSLTIR